MRRFLLDQIRWFGSGYLVCAVLVASQWFAPRRFSPRYILEMSLLVAFAAGPGMVSLRSVRMRELVVLPVSWRDRWRIQWILAVVLPVVVITLGNLIGLLLAKPVTWPRGAEVILLSVLCAAAYLGFCTGLLTVTGRRWYSRPIFVRVLILPVALAGALLAPILPTDLSELRRSTVAVMAAGLATGIWAWFHWSRLGPRPAPFTTVHSESVALPVTPPPHGRSFGGVVGLFRLALGRAAAHAVAIATLVLVPSLLDREVPAPVLAFMGTFVFLPTVEWDARLRQVRSLPLSAALLNAAILASSLTLLLAWLYLDLAAAAVPGGILGLPSPATVGVLVGVSALHESLRLRRRRDLQLLFVVALFSAVFVVEYRTTWTFVPSALQAVGIGVALITTAAMLNHHTLTRSSTAYEPLPTPTLPFGLPVRR